MNPHFVRVLWIWVCLLSVCHMYIHILSQIFSQDRLISVLWYFAWSWGTISSQNWRSRIFWENSHFLENASKWHKMAQFVYLPITTTFFPGLAHWFFLYFAWSWGTIDNQNWSSQILGENYRLPKSRPKRPSMAKFVYFPLQQCFSQDWLISFCWYFAWIWGTISTQNGQSHFVLKNSCLPKSEPKMSQMTWFLSSSVTATLFSGLTH